MAEIEIRTMEKSFDIASTLESHQIDCPFYNQGFYSKIKKQLMQISSKRKVSKT